MCLEKQEKCHLIIRGKVFKIIGENLSADYAKEEEVIEMTLNVEKIACYPMSVRLRLGFYRLI